MDRGRAIRTVFAILITFVLAGLVMLAGCLALAALQTEPVPHAGERPRLTLPGDPTAPAPLTSTPSLADAVDAALTAPVHPLQRETGGVVVELRDRNEPETDRRGVGVLDGVAHTMLAWRALPPAAAPQRVHFERLPAGEHLVVLAERERARYAYSTRAAVTVEAGRDTTATLDAHRQTIDVQVTLPPQLRPLATASLQRSDDPSWYAEPIAVPRNRAGRLSITLPMLGAGSYVLSLDGLRFEGSEDGTLALRVPGPTQITTTATPR